MWYENLRGLGISTPGNQSVWIQEEMLEPIDITLRPENSTRSKFIYSLAVF